MIQKLVNEGKTRSEKYHFLKFKLLLSQLNSIEFSSLKINSDLIIFLNKLSIHQLLDFGNDQFWNQIHKLSAELKTKSKANIEYEFNNFFISAFDSFFSLIPRGINICFNYLESGNIVFQKLGIKIFAKRSLTYSLIKSSNVHLKFEIFNTANEKIHEEIIEINTLPEHYRINKASISNNVTIFYQDCMNLYEKHYSSDLCCNNLIGESMFHRIQGAFEIIHIVDTILFEKLRTSIDNIVINGNDFSFKYPNFSIATLKRTIFLSIELLKYDDMHIAECIIHEQSHCDLHIIQDTTLLVATGFESVNLYSPWRKDPRPILGIIHAIFISINVLYFYKNTINSKIQNDKINPEQVLSKMEVIINQIQLAKLQLQNRFLTVFTNTMLNFIVKESELIENEFALFNSKYPLEVIRHIEQWKIDNFNSEININLNK
jgi:hypothetical protein